mgnify:CR=1 FL=1
MAKAVIWDMDGVLVDSALYHLRSWQILASELGWQFTEEQFWPTFGRRNQEVIRENLGPLPPAEVERLAKRKDEVYLTLIPKSLEPLPGVVALLEGLRQNGFRQAVASSSPCRNVHTLLASLGIRRYLDVVVTAEDVKVGKPNPEVFLAAARALGVSASCCAVIEDAVAGVEAAKAAGARCIAVTNSRRAEDLAAADLVVSSLEQVTPEQVEALLHRTSPEQSD